ncbi:hypothetical protein RUM43_009614 [Polyplax serrata]|uniref:Uncharacterized protein n=1 Tax=Polyplax serrata TaxID=468196 RepID=A0AAN8S1B8_POLSC
MGLVGKREAKARLRQKWMLTRVGEKEGSARMSCIKIGLKLKNLKRAILIKYENYGREDREG